MMILICRCFESLVVVGLVFIFGWDIDVGVMKGSRGN